MTPKVLTLVVDKGQLRAVYDDALCPLLDKHYPEAVLARGGRVQATDKNGARFLVDLEPVGGPVFYADESGNPFRTYAAAVAFEVAWVQKHWVENARTQKAIKDSLWRKVRRFFCSH
jgi:hypothetical protein